MAKLSFADRCVIFVMIVVGISAVMAGIATLMKFNYSEGPLVAIAVGGNIIIIVIIITIITKCSKRNRTDDMASTPPPLPHQDLPPNYRLTWRKEFIEKSPEHLKAYLERTLAMETGEDVRGGYIPHVLTTNLEAGVHSFRSLSTTSTANDSSLNGLARSETETSSAGSSSIVPAVVITSSDDSEQGNFDEGLPTYEEVQTW